MKRRKICYLALLLTSHGAGCRAYNDPNVDESPEAECRVIQEVDTSYVDDERTFQTVAIYTYDDRHLLEMLRSESSDGALVVENFHYDASSRLSLHQIDSDGDALADAAIWYDYGAGSEIEHQDHNGDGQADSITFRELDEAGRMTKRLLDENADSNAEIVETWSYGQAGILTHEWDYGADGIPERWETRHYNSEGSLVIARTETPGGVSRVEEREYEEDGRSVAQVRTDQDGDGAVDRWSRYERVLAEGIEEITVRHYIESEGPVQSIDVFEMVDDSPRSISRDSDADGTIDYRIEFTADEHGNELGWEVDEDGDGRIDATLERTFRCD